MSPLRNSLGAEEADIASDTSATCSHAGELPAATECALAAESESQRKQKAHIQSTECKRGARGMEARVQGAGLDGTTQDRPALHAHLFPFNVRYCILTSSVDVFLVMGRQYTCMHSAENEKDVITHAGNAHAIRTRAPAAPHSRTNKTASTLLPARRLLLRLDHLLDDLRLLDEECPKDASRVDE